MKAVKKPIEIEYWLAGDLISSARHDWESLPASIKDAYEKGGWIFRYDGISIPTLEGTMNANVDDIVIRGVNGEFYPCKPDIFEKTYDQV